MIKNFLIRILNARPLKAIAASPKTPAFILDFLWKAGARNPLNWGYVPSLWETILANPNTDLRKYENVNRQSLTDGKIKNPNATEHDLFVIIANLKDLDVDYTRRARFRQVAAHKNATPAVIAEAELFASYR